MPLIDFYGQFAAGNVECSRCGWTGLGSELVTGDTRGDGCENDCPACGETWGFVRWSVFVADDVPGWEANTGRVAD